MTEPTRPAPGMEAATEGAEPAPINNDPTLAPTSVTSLQVVLDQIDLKSSGATLDTLTAVTDIAIEIAREGREGRRIGTLFTVGAEMAVLLRSRSLILDPLSGHPPTQLSIHDPDLRETVKNWPSWTAGSSSAATELCYQHVVTSKPRCPSTSSPSASAADTWPPHPSLHQLAQSQSSYQKAPSSGSTPQAYWSPKSSRRSGCSTVTCPTSSNPSSKAMMSRTSDHHRNDHAPTPLSWQAPPIRTGR
jgi:hypothetical protein